MNMLTIAAFACLVAACAAQAPYACEVPPLWEGNILQDDRDKQVQVFGRLSYDKFGQRSRIIEQFNEGTANATYYDVLNLHNEGKQYIVDLQNKNCTVRPLTQPFRPFEVPQNATSRGEGYIGAAFEGVLVTFWELQTSDFFWFGEFSVPHCLPIREIYSDKNVGRISTRFYDLTAGIKDPNVFIPSSLCK